MEETTYKINALTSLYNNVLNDILFYQNNADSTNITDIIAVVIIPFLNVFNVDCVCQVESAEKGLEKVHNPISTVFFIKGLF